MFPPSLYNYITNDLGKKAILILNKIDLVEPEIVLAWKDYFITTYPNLSVVLFASCPVSKSKSKYWLTSLNYNKLNLFKKYWITPCVFLDPSSKKRKSIKIATEGVHSIFKECKLIVGDNLDLSSWEQKILEDLKHEIEDPKQDEDNDDEFVKTHKENYDFDFETHTLYKNGILTIGCVGFPNVGKSSLINALKGRKVVSVSRTPGHTKHFQTIFLTENVKLCDCPGLVFPSSTPKYIQVILGSFPIAQLREPYSSIKYLGERINLPKILNLQKPTDIEEWSAMAICEAWALKRGFLTAKASRPDYYRAANNILRMVLAGRIIFQFYPPHYFKTKEKWINHSELEHIIKIQGGTESNVNKDNLNLAISEPSDNSAESASEDGSKDSSDDDVLPNRNPFGVLDEDWIFRFS